MEPFEQPQQQPFNPGVDLPISPASEAPPEVVAAFMRFVQQNPAMFVGKQIELNKLKPVPEQMTFRCPHCDAVVLSGLEECPQCKKSTRLTLNEGDVVKARYQVVRRYSAVGGFGNLYSVLDLEDGRRQYAMKQLQHGRQVRDKERSLFEREGRILKRLDHPCIPRYHDAFSLHGALYLVMEEIDGVTLGRYIQAHGALDQEQIVQLLPQMLDVLRYLHTQTPPILHRDLKASNFMLTREGRLYLIDYGAANDPDEGDRPLGETGLPEDQTGVFTRGFAAPEVLMGGQALPQSDLFSLGTTIAFLLTKRHPFTHYDPKTGAFRVDDLPLEPSLKEVLARMLRIPVAERYSTALSVLEDLVARGYIERRS